MSAGHASVATPGASPVSTSHRPGGGRCPGARWSDPPRRWRAGALVGAAGYYLPYVRGHALRLGPADRGLVAPCRRQPPEYRRRMVVDGLADTLALIGAAGARTLYDGELARLVADMADRGGLVTPRTWRRTSRWYVRRSVSGQVRGRCGPTRARDRRRSAGGNGHPAGRPAARPMDRGTSRGWSRCSSACSTSAATRSTWPTTARPPRSTSCSSGLAEPGLGPPALPTCRWSMPWHGLLDHRVIRLRLGRDGPRHRTVAEQLPRRARAQPRCCAAPGERLRSNMAPTVGRRDDGSVLALGSPGADRITTALLQVLASFAHGGARCRRRSTGRGCTSTTSTRATRTGRPGSRRRRTCRSPTSTCRSADTTGTRCTSAGSAPRCGSLPARSRRLPTRVGPRSCRRQPLTLTSRPAGAARGRTSSQQEHPPRRATR